MLLEAAFWLPQAARENAIKPAQQREIMRFMEMAPFWLMGLLCPKFLKGS